MHKNLYTNFLQVHIQRKYLYVKIICSTVSILFNLWKYSLIIYSYERKYVWKKMCGKINSSEFSQLYKFLYLPYTKKFPTRISFFLLKTDIEIFEIKRKLLNTSFSLKILEFLSTFRKTFILFSFQKKLMSSLLFMAFH